jgi:recombinational DNA repair protein (RecF pathway)
MRECLTEAIVLSVKSGSGQDSVADFYTRELGRIRARVTSGRKILSKLTPHLDVLNLVNLRLVEKRQFIVADVVTKDRFSELRSSSTKLALALNFLRVLRAISYPAEPDPRLWHWLIRSFRSKRFNYREFLKILGYDPAAACCEVCGARQLTHFFLKDQSFLCYRCHTKFPKNKLLYLQ